MFVLIDVYVPRVHRYSGGQKRVSDVLDLKLQVVVNDLIVGAGNQNPAPLQEQQAILMTKLSLQPL